MANKLIDWLIAQVSLEGAPFAIIVSRVYDLLYMCVHYIITENSNTDINNLFFFFVFSVEISPFRILGKI